MMKRRAKAVPEAQEINFVDVVIAGEIITLKSTEDAAHLHRVAQYLDKKISEVTTRSTAVIDERTRTLLIALNITDECFKKMDGFKELDAVHKKVMREMQRMQAENTELQLKIKELQDELTKTRAELDEFINNFDDEEPVYDNILTLPRKAAN